MLWQDQGSAGFRICVAFLLFSGLASGHSRLPSAHASLCAPGGTLTSASGRPGSVRDLCALAPLRGGKAESAESGACEPGEASGDAAVMRSLGAAVCRAEAVRLDELRQRLFQRAPLDADDKARLDHLRDDSADIPGLKAHAAALLDQAHGRFGGGMADLGPPEEVAETPLPHAQANGEDHAAGERGAALYGPVVLSDDGGSLSAGELCRLTRRALASDVYRCVFTLVMTSKPQEGL